MTDDIPPAAPRRADAPNPAMPSRSWFQIRLSTLLAFVLGIGVGLAMRYQFGPEPSRLPNPSGIRLGDKLNVEVGGANVPESKRTALVLADGTISLPNLGQVPAAGLSLEELTADLNQRYETHYRKIFGQARANVFVAFADSSSGN